VIVVFTGAVDNAQQPFAPARTLRDEAILFTSGMLPGDVAARAAKAF